MDPADGDSAAGNAQTDGGQADSALADEAQSGDASSAAKASNVDFDAGHAGGGGHGLSPLAIDRRVWYLVCCPDPSKVEALPI